MISLRRNSYVSWVSSVHPRDGVRYTDDVYATPTATADGENKRCKIED